MAGDNCCLVRKHEGLVIKQKACARVCLCVVCSVGSGMVELCSWISSGHVRAQSRASSGWVFSLSPWSSCFSVPASTTDWDLNAEKHTCWLAHTHHPGVPVLHFMIFALVHSHLYGFLIIFWGKHKAFGKHPFK